MYEIVTKRVINPYVTLMDIKAPFVAKKAEPGQFIILRVDEEGKWYDFVVIPGEASVAYLEGGEGSVWMVDPTTWHAQ